MNPQTGEELPEAGLCQVTLRYAGRDVDTGSMDVEDLLAALNGFSSAFYRLADRESSESRQRIRVSGISRSSANVHLSIFEFMEAHPRIAAAVLGGAGYLGKKVVDTVLAKIAGVAKAKKHIQGGLYTTELSVSGDHNQVVIINGVGARLPVTREVLSLLNEGVLDADLDKMTSPLREDAVDTFEIRRDGEPVPELHLDASDRPYFARPRREAATTASLQMVGTMSTISKANNSGIFIAENGRRIRYRFINEAGLAELYRQFAHLGPVRVTCTAHLDENLEVISLEISAIEPLQKDLSFREQDRAS